MGWWKLTAWKKDSNGKDIELNTYDREHIAKQIEQGYNEGEVINGDDEA